MAARRTGMTGAFNNCLYSPHKLIFLSFWPLSPVRSRTHGSKTSSLSSSVISSGVILRKILSVKYFLIVLIVFLYLHLEGQVDPLLLLITPILFALHLTPFHFDQFPSDYYIPIALHLPSLSFLSIAGLSWYLIILAIFRYLPSFRVTHL